jgi:hypothetical protein
MIIELAIAKTIGIALGKQIVKEYDEGKADG